MAHAPNASPVQRTLTRRHFVYLTGLGIAGVAATACGGGDALPGQTPTSPSPQAATTGAAQPAATTAAAQPTVAQPGAGATQATGGQQTPAAKPASFKEAPQLAQQVKDGKLPPVDQRLPKSPLVVKPLEKTGKYGGTWRMGLLGGADTALLLRTIGYEHLVRWDVDWKQVIPNVAESFTAGPDAKEFTFKLRDGLKWSDGKPYSADDIVFYVEDIHKNTELTTSRGTYPVEAEKVDQHTVKLKFSTPNGLFLQRTATPDGDDYTRYPAHYLKQFHKKYNTTNLDQLIKDAGAKDWVELFRLKGMGIPGTPYDARWQNAELPSLIGWKITTPYGANAQRVVADRNPFFFKVDPEGNQLPYIDRCTFDVFQDKEALVLKAVNGEIDMQDRNIATNQNKPVFTDNQQKGQYRFFETIPASMNNVIIALNLTHKDPVKRQIFQNKDFRIGLSHAINRQEIIDVVYVGQGEPWQLAPRKESEFYNEKLAKQYTEFDVKKANEFLDKAFPKKDGSGLRLGPDGKPISFIIEVTGATGTDRVDTLNLVQKYWKAVGVDVQIKDEDRSLLYTRKRANEHDAVVWGGDGGLDVVLEPRWYFPFSEESNFAQAWYVWYAKPSNPGTAAEEPPPAAKKQMELYDQIKATGDVGKQTELMKQLLQIAQEEFWAIGIVAPTNGYGLVKNNMKNVPKAILGAWLYPNPAPTNPFTYYYE